LRKEKTKSSAAEKKKEVLTNLINFGANLYDQMEEGEFPWIKMPSRSIDNILYSPEFRQYILGEKAVRRSARNIRHIRPFSQLVWTAYFAHELVHNRKTSTLRDVYYSAQAYEIPFKDQQESKIFSRRLQRVS
jgi:DNA topoisomerase-6 subunit A